MIRLENITKIYNEKVDDTKALDDVSLKIEDGEFAAVMGASGSGKSTLLKIIGCMDTPTAGKYFLDNTEVTVASRSQVHKLRKEKIGYVFQHFALMDYYTAYENIELPLLAANVKRKERKRIILKQMEHLGILSERNKLPGKMSGGQQQRIAIARAIVNEPKVLLLDEPLGALDLKMRQDMQYELIRLKNELGITFIYVTHDQEEALTMSDTIVVMNQGYIQQIGTPEDIYNEPQNAFVADFIGESNIIAATMVKDKVVDILGTKFACVDEGFGTNKPVDVVIRPEDLVITEKDKGIINGRVISAIFKGVHYEMEIEACGFEWLVHSTVMAEPGKEVGLWVDPFNIQIMNKPESEDEKVLVEE